MTSTTKRPWLFLFLGALTGTALLFAACGGGDDDDDGGDDSGTNATRTAEGTDDGDDGGGEETPEGDGDDGGDDDDGGAGNSFEDLQNLTGGYANVTGRVTYETTDTDEGSASAYVIYSDPENNRSRFDSIDESGGVFSIISTPEATYTCTAGDAGGDDGVCVESPGGSDASALGLFGLFANPAVLSQYVNTLAGIDVSSSGEEIAGEDAECFSWEDEGVASGVEVSSKVCFASNGIMLLTDFESGDGTSTHTRATDLSTEVSDEDFEPPYPPLEIPGQ